MNRFQQLYLQRKAQATTEFTGRGARKQRCCHCQLPLANCYCTKQNQSQSQCCFALLMHRQEILRPSNTGRLIADLIPETHAFMWSRTEPVEGLLTLIKSADKQAYLVFPSSFATHHSVVTAIPTANAEKPLFILLDGSWREARKMFNQSRWLPKLPLLSINNPAPSHYGLRAAAVPGQLATAEVAAQLLALAGEENNAHLLTQRFNHFTQLTLRGRGRT